MPARAIRVDFYLLRDSRRSVEQVCCQLCAKVMDEGQQLAVLTRDPAHSRVLDQQLWQQPAARFIAHGIHGEASARHAPLLIGASTEASQVIVNLSDQLPRFDEQSKVQRILEIIADNDAARAAARQRYRAYQQQGAELHNHDLGQAKR